MSFQGPLTYCCLLRSLSQYTADLTQLQFHFLMSLFFMLTSLCHALLIDYFLPTSLMSQMLFNIFKNKISPQNIYPQCFAFLTTYLSLPCPKQIP